MDNIVIVFANINEHKQAQKQSKKALNVLL